MKGQLETLQAFNTTKRRIKKKFSSLLYKDIIKNNKKNLRLKDI